MKQRLLIVLVVLLCLTAFFAGIVAVQPEEFHITRSAVMKATPDKVGERIDHFKAWADWSPWAKLDPNSKEEFEGPAQGPGAIMKWSGNDEVGEGKMTILETRPGEYIKIQLDFIRPMVASNLVEFQLEPQGEETKVTWSMSGKNNFVGKAFHLIVDCDKMIGGDFEKGLNSMKALVEAPPQTTDELKSETQPEAKPDANSGTQPPVGLDSKPVDNAAPVDAVTTPPAP